MAVESSATAVHLQRSQNSDRDLIPRRSCCRSLSRRYARAQRFVCRHVSTAVCSSSCHTMAVESFATAVDLQRSQNSERDLIPRRSYCRSLSRRYARAQRFVCRHVSTAVCSSSCHTMADESFATAVDLQRSQNSDRDLIPRRSCCRSLSRRYARAQRLCAGMSQQRFAPLLVTPWQLSPLRLLWTSSGARTATGI